LTDTGDDTLPSEQEEESTDNREETDVVRKVITTSKTVQDDYGKMITILLKQTGLKQKDIDGMSQKEAFDKLSFLAEHTETTEPKRKAKNEPIVPLSPSGPGVDKIEGIKVTTNPSTGRKTYVMDPTKIFKKQ